MVTLKFYIRDTLKNVVTPDFKSGVYIIYSNNVFKINYLYKILIAKLLLIAKVGTDMVLRL